MPRYRFFICDVFTQQRFGGNQLAVLPDAGGLDTAQMQAIAREFNFSESTFVLPGPEGYTREVRIFTPTTEVPFAGHPNVGTAFALASDGALGDPGDGLQVRFLEKAGDVPVSIRADEGGIFCELQAPQPLSTGAAVDVDRIAATLSLKREDIVTRTHAPVVASVGLPFLVVELGSVDALRRARINAAMLDRFREDGIEPDIHLYTRSNDEFDIRARMFAPLDGVPEDPATGSANCALVALLASCDPGGPADAEWRIAQGVEMGRPSELHARTRRSGKKITTWIGGYSVLTAEGELVV